MSQPGTTHASKTPTIVEDLTSKLTDKLGDVSVDALKARLEDATAQAKQKGMATLMKTRQYITENPFRSIAIAFGAGYVLKLVRPGALVTLALLGGAGYAGTQWR
jgi:ElaB/YqjD/DUF883 family membrane-anchored ribosome-binding protein